MYCFTARWDCPVLQRHFEIVKFCAGIFFIFLFCPGFNPWPLVLGQVIIKLLGANPNVLFCNSCPWFYHLKALKGSVREKLKGV